MEQVVPGSIVYSDIKPEAIINDVRLVKYYPTSNVNGQLPNDVVRFELRGNGYFDPYSAYVYFEVQVPAYSVTTNELAGQVNAKLLDDSAHSLISRIVLRSEGTELERLENYDVLAKMLNDVTYTNEMRRVNHSQGFGVKFAEMQNRNYSVTIPAIAVSNNATAVTTVAVSDKSISVCLEPGDASMNLREIKNDVGVYRVQTPLAVNINSSATSGGELFTRTYDGRLMKPTNDGLAADGQVVFGTHGMAPAAGTAEAPATSGTITLRFTIPLYSGILGVLMPEKKMLPLSYLPIEAEFTLNPYAFYCIGPMMTDRSYVIKKMEIHSHVVTFEHDVALQMDSVVASQGLYIPFESFFQSATTVTSEGKAGQDTNITIPINAHFKSITSLHMVCVPSGYETNVYQKKLQFPSCNVSSFQLRNGINYLPSLPITGRVGDGYNGSHVLFFTELLKSWNRLHDHATPLPLSALEFQSNNYCTGLNTAAINTQRNVMTVQTYQPRCQYGISFLGEELGKDQSTITGKRGLTPFDLELQFSLPKKFTIDADGVECEDVALTTNDASSVYFIPYVKADFLLYIRPDLVVQILGK